MAKVRRQRRAARKRQSKQSLPSGTAPSMKVAFGKSALVKGTLRTSDSRPIGGQPVDVYRQLDASGQSAVRIATLRTNAGRRLRLPRSEGRQSNDPVRVPRERSRFIPPRAQVKLQVPASSTLKASRHNVLNGQTRSLLGQIGTPGLGRPQDRRVAGVLPREVAHVRDSATQGEGHLERTATASRRRAVSSSYKFRVRIRREASYPYVLGYSKVTTVMVRGR